MQIVTKANIKEILPYFTAAAEVANRATCSRAKCGTVIVKDSQIIGEGYNGPALGDVSNRTCTVEYDLTIKPKYDKTCCIHAEWRAILDACKRNADKIDGSTLYFMRVDETGRFTDAGLPYFTTCSRLSLEAGIGQFGLWNDDGADLYDTVEYNQISYGFYAPGQ